MRAAARRAITHGTATEELPFGSAIQPPSVTVLLPALTLQVSARASEPSAASVAGTQSRALAAAARSWASTPSGMPRTSSTEAVTLGNPGSANSNGTAYIRSRPGGRCFVRTTAATHRSSGVRPAATAVIAPPLETRSPTVAPVPLADSSSSLSPPAASYHLPHGASAASQRSIST